MKVPLIIFALIISYVLGDTIKFAEKRFPKKVKPYGTGKILINSKYEFKTKDKPKTTATPPPVTAKPYTVFQLVSHGMSKMIEGVPDSPYFPIDQGFNHKSRVKKILPDYSWSAVRVKRGAANEEINATTTKVEQKSTPSPNTIKPDKVEAPSMRSVQKEAGDKEETTEKKTEKATKKPAAHENVAKTSKNNESKAADKLDTTTKSKVKSTNDNRKIKAKPKGVSGNATATRRLIAAREALIEDYPYVVSIQKDDQHWCSGALLNPRLVITTANCLWKANRVSRMEVRAGSRYVDRGGQMAAIQEVMKHPGWGLRKSPDNDVALLLLDRNIKFSHSVHGVDLPNRVMLPPFDDAWVVSWGAERRDGIYDTESSTLQVFHTRLMNHDKCNNVTMRFSVIVSENFICLAQTGRTGPCTRDTGAPAVSDGILWGLASWGIRKLCGTERFPAMFSYLASHSNLDFIANATKSLMADKRYYPFVDRFPSLH
ncbi:transmembrane protease serine 11A-like isoform X2 [Spodoptera frugiperda]|uniref:Transmembrane protease serine 11A-like isoform X2 n=1 Tax=Spodoptera frugiperda TaxID=7108 RepID=A0A9R0DSF1_SPOFR|nr:transmembrane protease serine 11A-like isoform X2 [Spodoptera frugiperda]